ncbi:hypothetical protein [Planctomicrobium piriforme]|uniref:BON domain-containing protein n=1 Tax=Planctomicrobium piriforme TaxID=1576369 RepID=A0A1I3NGN2_9PLAN|nr:hypothetical protein [Planctomicrobium piriforme]SFJ08325.1 hypothetical protein SAMN05421753_11591 [Planctomicrobium piriforme]
MEEWTLARDSVPVSTREEALVLLEQQISHLTSGRIRDLRVQAVGEGILLSGRTSTYYVKQLATQIALDAHNPELLHNSIEVI